ncbi:hypothetical protein BDE02_06G015900 [Populus trichocarpa]|nr:hypothetical protein BDE02_06G015900 [Populus trichocarpa]
MDREAWLKAWLSLHHFFQETSMLTFTPQKQSNDQGLKKAIESERNGGARTSTITITMENGTFCIYLQ